jgi:hypothetical protein
MKMEAKMDENGELVMVKMKAKMELIMVKWWN